MSIRFNVSCDNHVISAVRKLVRGGKEVCECERIFGVIANWNTNNHYSHINIDTHTIDIMPPPTSGKPRGKDLTSLGIDRVPFYGARVPPNISAMKKPSSQLERTTFQKLTRLALSSTEGKLVRPEMFDGFATAEVSIETIHIVYAGILKIIQTAFRCSSAYLPIESFQADLKGINFSPDIISDLSSAIYGSRRMVLENSTVKNVPRNTTVVDFKWKIDVAISTTSLNRVLEPSVSASLTLSNGEIRCFEMSVAKFQELRYNVASVMKEMEDLEKRSILKIQD